MNERTKEIYTPEGGPPQGIRPAPGILEAIGEPGIFALLAEFYRKLGQSEVAFLFPGPPDALEAASQKSASFFIQVLGGRPLFSQHFGPPQMRMRHFPFEIDETARRVWLACFRESVGEAIASDNFPSEHQPSFDAFLEGFSAWMVNVSPA